MSLCITATEVPCQVQAVHPPLNSLMILRITILLNTPEIRHSLHQAHHSIMSGRMDLQLRREILHLRTQTVFGSRLLRWAVTLPSDFSSILICRPEEETNLASCLQFSLQSLRIKIMAFVFPRLALI